jgi:hypothetical protein
MNFAGSFPRFERSACGGMLPVADTPPSPAVRGGYRPHILPAGLRRRLRQLLRRMEGRRETPMRPGYLSSRMRRDSGLDDRPAGRGSDAAAFIDWDSRRP